MQCGLANACTSLCFDTPDGPIFAENLDLLIPGDGLVFVNRRGLAKESYGKSTTGETMKWVAEYGSVTFNLAGIELPWGGMNEAGLVVGTMQLNSSECPRPDERPPLSEGLLVQYALDTCADVEEAIAKISVVRLARNECASHFLIADAEGNGAAIEFLDGRFVCHTGEDLPVKAMTNMRYERALAALERGGPRWWWSNPGASAERFAGAAARIENYDASRDTSAVSYAFGTLVDVVAAPHTKWCVVYDIARREIHYGTVVSPPVKTLSLDAFDFSCDAPALMMDVNAPLEGNVEHALMPFDHATNLRFFSTFCDRWGIKVSTEGAADLMRLFESFECVR